MDPDSPVSRVERTLWTVWAYITEAVNRFLRPQPANTVYNDPHSFQESAVDSEPPDCGPAEGDTGKEGVDEEQPLATASQLSSSRPVVVWELSATDVDVKPDEESVRYKKEPSRSSEGEESADGEGRGEEQIGQRDDTEGAGQKEDKQEKTEIEKLGAHDETPEDDEQVKTGLQILTDDAISEDKERREGKEGDEEETVNEHQEIVETVTKTHVGEEEAKMQHEDGQDLKADEVKRCTMMDSSPEEEDVMLREDSGLQKDDAASVVTEKEEAGDCEGLLQLATENKSDEGTKQAENQLEVREVVSEVSDNELIAVGGEHVMVHRSESDKSEDEGVKEDEREQEEQNNEATSNQTLDEEQENNIRTVTEDYQEENILTECEEAVQSNETWLHPAEFTNMEKEDVAIAEVQTKTRDVAITGFSSDDKDQPEEEMLYSKEGNKDLEVACTHTSVTVKPEGETGQEVSSELGDTPLGISEGWVVMSQELNTPTCEETQEGVPGYNNELGPDENTTQWFLEAGDYEERQTTRLPEEVESEEQESLQNSGWGMGADYLLATEPMEEKQEGTEGIKNSFDLAVEEQIGIQNLTDAELTQKTERLLAEPLESGHLLEGEELLESSMKTEIKYSGFTDDSITEELQDGAEELLVDFGIDAGSYDSKEAVRDGAVGADEAVGFADETSEFLEAEMQKMTETSFSQQFVHDVHPEQNSSWTPSLLEDISEFGFLKPLVEIQPKLLDDSSLEMQDAGIDVEGKGHGEEEEEEAEDETHLWEAGMEDELITEMKEKGTNLITDSGLSQSADRALEISEEEVITADESKTTEFKPKDLSAEETAKHVRESEGTNNSVSGDQDVIDEEILDLWIKGAMSEDADGLKQEEEPEPEQQMDTGIGALNEEQGDITSEKENKQLHEPHSGESGSARDTQMSSSTLESGLLNQSLGEWDPNSTQTPLLKSASIGSLQGIQDMLVGMSESADISEFSAQTSHSESKDALMEETTERTQSYLKEEAEERNLKQVSDGSQEKTDETARSVSAPQKETDEEAKDHSEKTDWKNNEETDVASLMKMSVFVQIEETKFENEPLEISVSDSADDIKHHESGSGSEASLEEEIVTIELDSQGNTWTEKSLFKLPSLEEPLPEWSEAESLSELERAEVAEEPATTSEDQEKVVAPVLDFTVQRSRIAVKNPRVRPPKDPRSLLHMPSVDPTPSTHVPVKAPMGVPLGGLGIGIKLPGLGAGFPVLKKTRVVKEENNQETLSQEPEVKPEEKSDAPQQNEAQHRPKWMPPRHPGFGNPLMSELKTKLKKTTQE